MLVHLQVIIYLLISSQRNQKLVQSPVKKRVIKQKLKELLQLNKRKKTKERVLNEKRKRTKWFL